MMAHTDRDFRYLLRLISRRVMLYTEMMTTSALLRGGDAWRLEFHPSEHPLGIQLAGADAQELGRCARIAEEAGYDELNFNLGCPSARVSNARFGACLMAEPDLVARCVAAMCAAARLPVTVKTRVGIDSLDSYEDLHRFISIVAAAGCRTFILHARKAWLNGLSPRQNRQVPPLRYDLVYRVKQEFAGLEIIINGGIDSVGSACAHLRRVDGAMIGRAACRDPYLLAEADARIFGDAQPPVSRVEVLRKYLDYTEDRMRDGVALHRFARPMQGLLHGQRGVCAFRRHLSEKAHRRGSGPEVIREAMRFLAVA